MARKKKSKPIPWSYILAAAAAVLFTWILHELAHWYAGEVLGNEMTMTLNSARPVSGIYSGRWHAMIVSAAGPFITLVEAFIFYRILKKEGDEHLFPVLITCVYMRTLAAAMSFIKLNDEARISADLGLGTFTLPLLVIALLLWWLRAVIRERKYTPQRIAGTVLLVMIFSSVLVLADQFLRLTLI